MSFDADRADKLRRMLQDGASMPHLERMVGGLSKPSKMPWLSYSLPAQECRVGGALRKREGSVCNSCYARKGRYVFSNVQAAMYRRFAAVTEQVNVWAAAMVVLLERKSKGKPQHFRWHDSGDLQGAEHFRAIIWIAKQLPHIKFWLPTKEYALVSTMASEYKDVPNLNVRVSEPWVGRRALRPMPGTTLSTVDMEQGHQCPAYSNGGKCGPCRACWDKDVPVVNYPLH